MFSQTRRHFRSSSAASSSGGKRRNGGKSTAIRHAYCSMLIIGTVISILAVLALLRYDFHRSASQTRDLLLDLQSGDSLLGKEWSLQLPTKPVSSVGTTQTIVTSPKESSKQTSRSATVMGMATNYPLHVYKRFVGSLRRSGFQGNIILIVSQRLKPGVEEYLTQNNVTMKPLQVVNCTNGILSHAKDSHEKEVMTCANPYPHLKVRWGRFALLRDYLQGCAACTGSVLVADVRDTFFQRDPFGPEAPPVHSLHLVEEHRTMRTTHWLVKRPVERCKGSPVFDEPMLCSGTTIGTRDSMLQYLQTMVEEMEAWMEDPKCCCNPMNGDDQSIHNYLYYTGRLPHAVIEKNRFGLVHTVGSQGAMIFNAKRATLMGSTNMTQRQASIADYNSKHDEIQKGNWLGLQYDLTDANGYFIDFNGQRSFIIHQYDRFGLPFEQWLDRRSGLVDP